MYFELELSVLLPVHLLASQIISNTLPRGHFSLGLSGTAINTTSFSFIYLYCLCHFFLDALIGNHSFVHLFQKWHTIFWILWHLFFGWYSPLSTESVAKSMPVLSYRKQFGVIGTSPSGYAVWYVNCLELISDSAPMIAIISSSSIIPKFPKKALITLLAALIVNFLICVLHQSGLQGWI